MNTTYFPIKSFDELDAIKVFQTSHQEMENGWKGGSDYALGVLEKAICEGCSINDYDLVEKEWVVVQVGAFRFGLEKVGVCFDCIGKTFSDPKLNSHEMNIPFTSSKDIHSVNITPFRLNELLEREVAIGKTQPEQPLPQECKKQLQEIVQLKFKLLQQSKEEQEKRFSCKDCKKIRIDYATTINMVNLMRLKSVTGVCLGCLATLQITEACSIATCFLCVSNTKTCIVCQEGATEIPHNLENCSKLGYEMRENAEKGASILPQIQLCACDNK